MRERRTANHPRGNSRAEIKARSVVTGEMREREGEPKGSSKNKNEDEDNQYVVSRPVRPFTFKSNQLTKINCAPSEVCANLSACLLLSSAFEGMPVKKKQISI